MSDWQPIDTAPVKPWTPGLESYYGFRCLLQNDLGHVFEGSARYVGAARKQVKGAGVREAVLRWYNASGNRWEPNVVYWMPMPEARKP